MMMNNINGFKQNLFLKYLQLYKNFLILQNKIQINHANSNYKTELCKQFLSRGYCPYGRKCRFAHGTNELIKKIHRANYKKEKCKSFYENGYCSYGSRCQFRHDERKFKNINISYFYLRFFLFKYSGFLQSYQYYFKENTSLFNNRLPVFDSLTHYFNEDKNIDILTENVIHLFDSSSKEDNNLRSKSNNSIDDTNSNSNKFLIKEIYENINELLNYSD